MGVAQMENGVYFQNVLFYCLLLLLESKCKVTSISQAFEVRIVLFQGILISRLFKRHAVFSECLVLMASALHNPAQKCHFLISPKGHVLEANLESTIAFSPPLIFVCKHVAVIAILH